MIIRKLLINTLIGIAVIIAVSIGWWLLIKKPKPKKAVAYIPIYLTKNKVKGDYTMNKEFKKRLLLIALNKGHFNQRNQEFTMADYTTLSLVSDFINHLLMTDPVLQAEADAFNKENPSNDFWEFVEFDLVN